MTDETAQAIVKLLETEVRGLHERVNLLSERLQALGGRSESVAPRLNYTETKLDRLIERLLDNLLAREFVLRDEEPAPLPPAKDPPEGATAPRPQTSEAADP